MKVYQSLLLAYVDIYHIVDYDLLAEEFHVTVRQIMDWLAQLKESGYIEAKNKGFYVTPAGKEYKSVSWKRFVSSTDNPEEEHFKWDDLYIPEHFDPEHPE